MKNCKFIFWAGSPKPRSASVVFFAQNTSDSEWVAGATEGLFAFGEQSEPTTQMDSRDHHSERHLIGGKHDNQSGRRDYSAFI